MGRGQTASNAVLSVPVAIRIRTLYGDFLACANVRFDYLWHH